MARPVTPEQIATAAIEAGQAGAAIAHLRVGLEDNLYLERGVLARSNAALVEKAAALVAALGEEVATPAQARESLGLNTQGRTAP